MKAAVAWRARTRPHDRCSFCQAAADRRVQEAAHLTVCGPRSCRVTLVRGVSATSVASSTNLCARL